MSFQEYSQSIAARLRLGEVNPKLAVGIAVIALVSICAVIAVGSVAIAGAPAEKDEASGFAIESEETTKSDVATPRVCVYVSGCVATPGVVYLDEGARVDDAISAAGGMTSDAAADALNLARPLEDGEQITVLSAAELASATAASQQYIDGEYVATSAMHDVQTRETPNSNASGKVNLNTASASELQTLSGIGQSKADKIISFREANGPFSSVDDLTNVSGIGEKTLDAIREQICV